MNELSMIPLQLFMSLLTANRVKSQKCNNLFSTHNFKTNEIKIRFIGLYTDISIECQYNNTYMNIYIHIINMYF